MEEMLIIKSLVCLVLCYSLLILIGNIIASFLPQQINISNYIKLLLGVLILATSFAIFRTGGKTILILYVALAIIMVLYYRQNFSFSWKWKKFKLREDFIMPLFVLLGFFIVFLISYTENSISPDYFFIDYYYYARASSYLRDFGIENLIVEYFLDNKGGLGPYHYLELWLNSSISCITNIHSLKSLFLITYPLLYTVLSLGILDLIRTLNDQSNNYLKYPFLFLILFLVLSVPDLNLLFGSELFQLPKIMFPVTGHHKYIFIYIFGVSIIKNIYEKKFVLTSFMVCYLVIAQVSVAISLMFTLGIGYLYMLFIEKDGIQKFIKRLFPLLFTSVGFYIFYKVFGDSNNIALSLNEILEQYDSVEELTRIVNIIGKTSIQLIFNLGPILLLYLLLKLHKIKALNYVLVFVLLTHMTGIVTWGVLNQMQDSVQLWNNSTNPTLIFFVFIIIYFSINKLKNRFISITSLVGLILIFMVQDYLRYGEHYSLISASDIIKEEKNVLGDNPRVVFIKEKEDYKNSVSKYEQVYNGQVYKLMQQYDPLQIMCISIDKIENNSLIDEKYYNLLTFVRYMKQRNGSNLSFDDLQLKFIQEKDITHMLVNNHRVLPQKFRNVFNQTPVGSIDGYSIYKKLDRFE